ncbi:TetR/AcrR family transcriptional regulator [Rhodococcus sp. H29-C3]|uniref:TetR/AcrR family transcriptional regulator n=1 Tax=Rhodococcus sp. H29-C3 TaxID=3046307 RepID=UPI0024BA4ADC|nr:TetR/AcrR family transcriptional regulator [Rhodococcus sp. H29-C3]MDJ0362556.1 TetR/AcrR family transcriptional regulator [Rhodococcus sp. H29-C3]
MPPTYDPSERRRHVGNMLLELIADEGLAGTNIRAVAELAGCSVGAIQKYFRTKDDMLEFALQLVGERVEARLQSVDRTGTLVDVVRNWLLATLPLDAERRAEARIWAEFSVRAIGHRPYSEAAIAVDNDIRAALTEYLEEGRRQGAVSADIETSTVADALIATSDGLALTMLYDEGREMEALAALDVVINRLLPLPGPTLHTRRTG